MRISMTHPTTHAVKQTKIGFSWTTFFFGFFPALLRGDWKWALIIAVLQIGTGTFTWGISIGLISIIFAFVYNRLYINELINHGFAPSDQASADALRAKNFLH
ncbi:DUF2628 domain-containing protein [Lacticaseibacillus parakribbianus]|uniref:DUF2628 domain-containing protein n=1 Tax=Lacticaseibacillus parakribbianus TaxID=2970927 RepID=UPI0021CB60B3|nr:DUF2628 domain-containing protein [Lacticaseibacillus parakribbianus]